jgi:hypothetical protein
VLDSVAAEFGQPVPLEQRPADEAAIWNSLLEGLRRRERCFPAGTILESDVDAVCHSALSLLERAVKVEELESLLATAWRSDAHHTPDRPSLAMARMRAALLEALSANGESADSDTTGRRLRALEAAHGPVRRAVADLALGQGAEGIPDGYLFRPEIAQEHPALARERAREKVDQKRDGLLAWGADEALLVLEPDLDDKEVEGLLGRVRFSNTVTRLLDQASERRPGLAREVLRRSRGFGMMAAGRRVGREARPLLLRQLHAHPLTFSLERDPVIHSILGPSELRLAAEGALALASDATDVIGALALLPGEEARDGLQRLLVRVNRLDPDADNGVRGRAWNVLCTREHLVRLLPPEVVRAALKDEGLASVNRVLLLRAHPDADHAKGQEMWRRAALDPRFALDVLRATGSIQLELAREAVERGHEGRADGGQAARTAAGLVRVAEADESLEAATRLAADPDLPATVRAVACFVTGTSVPVDPAMDRYRRWHETRRPGHPDPLIDLLSGAWQHAVVP